MILPLSVTSTFFFILNVRKIRPTSYEQCGRIIKRYSSRPGLDLSELFTRILFSFIIGNSNMHLKNFSLIESAAGSREYSLSAAYDMLPVNIVLPEDKEEMALTLNGKKRRLKKRDFMSFASKCGIAENAAEKMLSKMCSLEDKLLCACEDSYLPEKYIEQTKQLITTRIAVLKEG
ncbi:HipA domain-containing protein [Ruminococcus sp. AM22-14LB]|jgi:serine/threonine-protein kinase HipA|uniref:HipA domain-containing protein n=1 Tax=[Ruminococcus] torques TaxID=33039 RepID=UPI000E4225E5|nr:MULTISPECIES: HipA domain-containing protein [Mediterraneibacter]RGF01647.1 HipA domain-containing protein [Ruminococcus sp. AM22-14LB]RGH95754.1 HipA domain-containing protein [Ruminococcus sp. AM27-27]RGH97998.1 HipA domain-containing protein [Ruminococcus sp. AM27-11LB]RGI28223.1 HipA domain-containing protein [Ruminococcus sp. OM08-13AT]RGI52121.1 HipA domain-containing protein [Ruminococcus sp. OF05-2BH]